MEPITTLKPSLSKAYIFLGCDPEFFFERNGKILGSEKIIDPVLGMDARYNDKDHTRYGGSGKIIVDGVQVELNPQPNTCREILASSISVCFRRLYEKMKDDKSLKLNFKPSVKITKSELDTLDEKSKILGCSPSKSAANKGKEGKIKVSKKRLMYRSAGGHIHIGSTSPEQHTRLFATPEKLVDLLDIIVGNTCVLIDRDEGNKIRRQVYGKAGEFRTPKHGLEYRTLSNFWLRSYPLMSLVMNLTRMAVSINNDSLTKGLPWQDDIFKAVDIKKVRKAINQNDFDLAKENWEKIRTILAEIVGENSTFAITASTLPLFDFFVEKGIDYWFPQDPLDHWIKLYTQNNGWESFLTGKVAQELGKTLTKSKT